MSRWPQRTLAERFWEKVDRTGIGCWPWLAAKDRRGYGRFQLGIGLGTCFAHRLAYELHIGLIPDGYELDHLCFNPSCVRPDHLRPILPQAHRQQAVDRIRAKAAKQTHCKHGHPFDRIDGGRRRCTPCRQKAWTKANAKRRGHLVPVGRSEDPTP